MTDLFDPNQKILLDHFPSAVLISDPDGKIIYANPALCALADLKCSELQEQPVSHWIRVLNQKTDTAAIQKAHWQSPNQEARTIKIKNATLPNGLNLAVIDLFSEDTTLTQAHAEFVSTVSHEFRTPLTSIKGFADTLLKYGNQLDEAEQRRFIHIMKDQADRLIRLVENLLVVSKLGASRMDMAFRPVPLNKLLERITQSIQIKSTTKHPFIVKIPPTLPAVWADADRLEQVLTNLIDNAVKYSEDNTPVTITAFEDSASERVIIRVQDEGPGIPPQHLAQLFTKFYRIEGPLTQKVEGTGLGLYITKSLVSALGGEISVESPANPDKKSGTVFQVSFSAATPERQAAYHRRLSDEEVAYVG